MADIQFNDFFDFDDKSQIEKGKQGIKDLEKAFADFLTTVNSFSMRNLTTETKNYADAIKQSAKETKALSIVNTNHQKSLVANLAAMQKSTAAFNAAKAAQQSVKSLYKDMGNSVDGMTNRLKALEAQYVKMDGTQRASARGQNIAARYQKLAQQISEVTSSFKQGTSVVRAAEGSYKQLDNETKKLIADLKNLGGVMGKNNPVAKAMAKQIYDNTQRLKEFDRGIGQNFRNVGNYKSALDGLKGSLKDVMTQYLGIAALTAGAVKVFDLTVKLDSVKTSLNFVTGSAIKGSATFGFLSETADKLNLNLESLITGYQRLAGATFDTNFQGQKTREIFLAVAKSSAVLRVSAADTEAVMRALGQIISKGKVQAEELRGQLGDRMSGAFNLFAKGLGVTTGQLDKMLQKGEVTSDALLKFAEQLNKTFDPGVAEAADTLQGSINRLSNTFTDAVSRGNMAKFFQVFVDGLASTGERLNRLVNSSSWSEFFDRFTTVGLGFLDTESQRTKDVKYDSKDVNKSLNSQFNTLRKTLPSNGDYGGKTFEQIDQVRSDLNALYEQASAQLAKLEVSIEKGALSPNDGVVKTARAGLKNLMDEIIVASRASVGIYNKYKIAREETEKNAVDPDAEKKRLAEERKREAAARRAEAALKRRLKEAEDLAKATTDKLLAELDIKLANDLMGATEDQQTEILIQYEKDRFKIIMDGLAVRQEIYKNEKEKFAELEADKLKATADRIEKINKLEEDAAKRRSDLLKRLRELEKEGNEVDNESDLNSQRNAVNRRFVGRYGPNADLEKANALYDVERTAALQKYMDLLLKKTLTDRMDLEAQAEIDLELKKQLATLKQIGEENLNMNAEAESERRLRIIGNMYNGIRDLSDEFLADNPMKFVFDSILDYIQDFNDETKSRMEGWADIVIGATQSVNAFMQQASENRMRQLEIERDKDIEAAGDNAKAKENAEKRYQLRIAQERRKAAMAAKIAALFQIAVNTAVSASLALSAPPLGLGPILGIPVATKALIFGAVQAAIVAATPLPKYRTGRGKGKEEYAVVGDGGAEIVESEDGGMRYFQKEQVTKLKAGDKVHTASETKNIVKRWTESDFSDKVINSFISGTQVVRAINAQEKQEMYKVMAGQITEKGMEKAMASAISKLPIQQLFIDEKGARTYNKSVNGRIQDMNARNSMGGLG